MARGSSEATPTPPNPNKDVGGMKYVARFIGGAGGIVSLALGAWTCVTLTPATLLAGIWLMLTSFLVLLIEAPCLCVCVEFVGKVSTYFDKRAFWHRSIIYVILSIVPVILSQHLTTIFGCLIIFVTGGVYGVISLGKKGSPDQMKANVSSESMKDSLISNDRGQIP